MGGRRKTPHTPYAVAEAGVRVGVAYTNPRIPPYPVVEANEVDGCNFEEKLSSRVKVISHNFTVCKLTSSLYDCNQILKSIIFCPCGWVHHTLGTSTPCLVLIAMRFGPDVATFCLLSNRVLGALVSDDARRHFSCICCCPRSCDGALTLLFDRIHSLDNKLLDPNSFSTKQWVFRSATGDSNLNAAKKMKPCQSECPRPPIIPTSYQCFLPSRIMTCGP